MVFYTRDILKLLSTSPCFSFILVQHFRNSINSWDYSSVYYLQLPVAKGWKKGKSKAAFLQKQHAPFSTKLTESTDGNLRTVIHTHTSVRFMWHRDAFWASVTRPLKRGYSSRLTTTQQPTLRVQLWNCHLLVFNSKFQRKRRLFRTSLLDITILQVSPQNACSAACFSLIFVNTQVRLISLTTQITEY